jgi:hypothetical protein
MRMADFTEKTKVSWPVLVAVVALAFTTGGFAVRGETTRALAEKNEAGISTLEAKREADRDNFSATVGAMKVQLENLSVKMDLLLRQNGIRPAGGR